MIPLLRYLLGRMLTLPVRLGDDLAAALEMPRWRGRMAMGLLLAFLAVLAAPGLPLGPYRRYVLERVRDGLAPWILLLFACFMAVGLLAFLLTRRGGASRERLVDRILVAALTVPAFAGLAWSALPWIESPSLRSLRLVHASLLEVAEVDLFWRIGGMPLPKDRGAYMEDCVQTLDNVIVLRADGARRKVFAEPVTDLQDFLVLHEMVLVTAGSALWRTDADGGRVKLADLPGTGFRFGQRVDRNGLSSRILVFGNVGARGLLFDLTRDGRCQKLAEVEGVITAAAGAYDQAVIALGDRLVLLALGSEPGLLFQAPAGSGPFVSVLARAMPDGNPADVLWLAATRDGVFALRQGGSCLALAGLGGELRSAEDQGLDAYLYDAPRHAAVRLDFPGFP